MAIKNSRIRLKQRREVALGLVEGHIKYYSNNPQASLRGKELEGEEGKKYIATRLRQLNEQKAILEERIKSNAGRV